MSMYTEPQQRGKGLATRIATEAMKWARKNGYPRMTLHASDLGKPIYLKLGWKQTSEMRFDIEPLG